MLGRELFISCGSRVVIAIAKASFVEGWKCTMGAGNLAHGVSK